jgi:hypothetical protein
MRIGWSSRPGRGSSAKNENFTIRQEFIQAESGKHDDSRRPKLEINT